MRLVSARLWEFAALIAAFLALASLVGCGSSNEPVTADDDLVWSRDRFALSAIRPGTVHYGDAFWMARLSAIAYEAPTEAEAALRAIGVSGELAFFTNPRTGTQGIYIGMRGCCAADVTSSRTYGNPLPFQ